MKKKMTKQEYIEWCNNPRKYGKVIAKDDVEPCGCGFPNCNGWKVINKKRHICNASLTNFT